ncbi:hypothetical protein K438DRAFT_717632 [Mycena galopus ATCC 62051]|nr:hypothetical protein K438DRAFT_717632 [Mycena galopus ATCC 62051]
MRATPDAGFRFRESRCSRYRSTLPCSTTPHAVDVLHILRYRLVKDEFCSYIRPHRRSSPPADSNDFPSGLPVRARPSSALPIRSSQRAARRPHHDLRASATDTAQSTNGLSQLRPLPWRPHFTTSLDVRHNFPRTVPILLPDDQYVHRGRRRPAR